MRKLCLILILFVFIFGLAGCDYANWRKIVNKDEGFSLYIPRNWEIDDQDTNANAVLVAFAPNRGAADNFATNIRVVMEELPAEVPLSTYYDINRAEFEQLFRKLDDVQEGQGMTGLIRYQWISFSTLIGEEIAIRATSVVWMKGKRVYVLTCVTNLRRAEEIKPIFKKMISSFRIL